MRRIAIVTLLACSALSQAQVWEKLVAPGLTYRMEFDLSGPRLIHALRWTPGSEQTRSSPELGRGVVFMENVNESRETISDMVTRTGAVAGINADFFPFTGDPLGLMVKDRVLLSKPFPNRSVFAWGPTATALGDATWSATMVGSDGRSTTVDGVNEEANGNVLVVNTAVAGFARFKGEAVVAVFTVKEGTISPSGTVKAEFGYFLAEPSNVPVKEGNILIVATGTRRADLRAFKPGDVATFKFSINGFDWTTLDHAVGGGPSLVRNGKIAIDADKQGFNEGFSARRHPRTMVGRTETGDTWWVAVDGRQTMSVGATLEEAAHVMLKLGCVDAINLDGGGSTTLNLNGVTVNRPSDGSERPVANGVLFFGPKIEPASEAPSFSFPQDGLMVGQQAELSVRLGGAEVPAREVIWGAQGAGWIDQGGMLRGSAPGTATVRAWVRGRTATGTVAVRAAARAPQRGRSGSRSGN